MFSSVWICGTLGSWHECVDNTSRRCPLAGQLIFSSPHRLSNDLVLFFSFQLEREILTSVLSHRLVVNLRQLELIVLGLYLTRVSRRWTDRSNMRRRRWMILKFYESTKRGKNKRKARCCEMMARERGGMVDGWNSFSFFAFSLLFVLLIYLRERERALESVSLSPLTTISARAVWSTASASRPRLSRSSSSTYI